MSLFDDLGNTLNKVANSTIKKSKELSGLTKLSLKLNSEEGDLDKLYEGYGKAQYGIAKNIAPTDALDFVALIDEKIKVIEDLKSEIEQLKGVIICPKCGTKNKVEDSFCSSCGEKLPKPEPEEPKTDPDKEEE